MKNALKFLTRLTASNYKAKYRTAKSTGTCIECGNPAEEFRNVSSRVEYAVSALCQKCQDRYFGEGPDDFVMDKMPTSG